MFDIVLRRSGVWRDPSSDDFFHTSDVIAHVQVPKSSKCIRGLQNTQLNFSKYNVLVDLDVVLCGAKHSRPGDKFQKSEGLPEAMVGTPFQ